MSDPDRGAAVVANAGPHSITGSSSRLLHRLDETASSTTFIESPRAIFDRFANKVSLELQQINQLFDEYTPHDRIHMTSLLRITDELLGDEVIGNLNGCEACILACAIYGHDWGMAVSEDEKEMIVTDRPSSEGGGAGIALLPDERERWRRFANLEGISSRPDGHVDDRSKVTKDLWREYVRQTHAERARVRVIQYFRNERDLGQLGEPVGEVCAGHWYDIADIRRMPTSWSVGGQSVNVQALAIYMRFIDLLDIGNNRTPFTLWKFINPRNVTSAIEWKKHQAVNPVTIRSPAKNQGSSRVLQVHGTTDDHRVFAALQDLKEYFAAQIAENVSTLEGLEGYGLGHISLDWQVEANGFKPINIRFDFDRNSMFDLVSGEIYDGDPYVFIRELLQNAIDATDLRQRQCKKRGLLLDNPTIRVVADHQGNGDATITITDMGTGMDEDIVREYLAVIGRSYYRSKEFADLATGMTPISRFGVGLLSCFEVADQISIRTKGEAKDERLDIEITDRAQQFRVQNCPDVGPAGTSIRVWTKASKWRRAEFGNSTSLNITDYIKTIAGFVRYPICIDEAGKRTVVCSALTEKSDLQAFQARFRDAEIFRLSDGYSLEEAIVPQDLEAASGILETHTLQISSDLDNARIAGFVSHFTVKDSVLSSTRSTTGGAGATYTLEIEGTKQSRQLRWAHNPNEKPKPCVPPSAQCSYLNLVFLQGILVPDAKLKLADAGGTPPKRVIVNIESNSDELAPQLSRRGLRFSLDAVNAAIGDKFREYVRDRYLEEFRCAQPVDRLFLLARLARYLVPPQDLLQCLPSEELPLVRLERTGTTSLVQLDGLPQEIEIAPKYLFQQQKHPIPTWSTVSISRKAVEGADQIVRAGIPMVAKNFGFEFDDGSAMEWNDLDSILSQALAQKYRLKSMRLGRVNDNPYLVEVHEVGEAPTRDLSSDKWLNMGRIEFARLEPDDQNVVCLMSLRNDQLSHNQIYELTFNSNHPISILFSRTVTAVQDKFGVLEPRATGRIKDAFEQLPTVNSLYTYTVPNVFESMVVKGIAEFCFTAADLGIINLTEEERACLRGCPISCVVPCYQ